MPAALTPQAHRPCPSPSPMKGESMDGTSYLPGIGLPWGPGGPTRETTALKTRQSQAAISGQKLTGNPRPDGPFSNELLARPFCTMGGNCVHLGICHFLLENPRYESDQAGDPSGSTSSPLITPVKIDRCTPASRPSCAHAHLSFNSVGTIWREKRP